jgi:hypothetical protein
MYGCPAWGSVVNRQCARTKLLSLLRLYALRILRGFCTLSTEASLVLDGLRVREQMAQYSIRRNDTLSALTAQDLKALQVDEANLERRLTYSQLPHPSQQTAIASPSDDYIPNTRHISIYTDGSKGEGVGAAFTVFDNLSSSPYNNVSQLPIILSQKFLRNIIH